MTGPARRPRVRTEDIVSTAAELFARDGYHEVGMRAVADALGIRGASLYHHYASKEEILYAIALTVTQEPVEQQPKLLDLLGRKARSFNQGLDQRRGGPFAKLVGQVLETQPQQLVS